MPLLKPLPHQIAGAEFLAARKAALLADAPRVGKTGAAIIACDYVGAQNVLVVTTASGRAVWRRAWRQWSALTPPAKVLAWTEVTNWDRLFGSYDVVILDESHYAKNPEAKRTKAIYDLQFLAYTDRVWCLTGTPIPNAANDLWPMLNALCPERIDGMDYDTFLHRYCKVRPKRLSPWKVIQIVQEGRNLDELKARLNGFWLRRTQEDIGITAPIFDLLPIAISSAQRKKLETELGDDATEILDAAETGETRSLEMHLGTLRRVTGSVKADGVVQAVKDEFEGGLDKVVLMAWHKDTLDRLEHGLSSYGAVRVDGSTTPDKRDAAQRRFQNDPAVRVFVGQIIACGEAIDLSAAAELVFVESSFVPKDMAQAALRITNIEQKRQPRVRVAALEGSIDEALQTILTRKVRNIKEVLDQ